MSHMASNNNKQTALLLSKDGKVYEIPLLLNFAFNFDIWLEFLFGIEGNALPLPIKRNIFLEAFPEACKLPQSRKKIPVQTPISLTGNNFWSDDLEWRDDWQDENYELIPDIPDEEIIYDKTVTNNFFTKQQNQLEDDLTDDSFDDFIPGNPEEAIAMGYLMTEVVY